jgi:hypothetical protein
MPYVLVRSQHADAKPAGHERTPVNAHSQKKSDEIHDPNVLTDRCCASIHFSPDSTAKAKIAAAYR